MSSSISLLRKRWLVLAAMVVLIAVALTAGNLFAANERQQPELPTVSQPSAMDATDLVAAVEPRAAPPAPERIFSQPADEQIRNELPPITKQPPAHPNLDANLNRLVEQATGSSNPASTENAASAPSTDPVLVTFYVEPQHVDALRQYLEDNDVYVRNVGEDYIEAHVPPLLLSAASEQTGVLRVDTVIPPQPAQSQSRVISQGVGLHGADAWRDAGYRGQGVKVGIIDTGFERFSELQQGGELPPNVLARCYLEGPRPPSSRLSDCEADSVHGTAVAETVIDVAPDAQLYVTQPHSPGDLRNAVDWMASQGVQVINLSLGYPPDGPGDGTSPRSDSPLRTIDAAVSDGITVVIAIGNDAKKTWFGAFSDTENNGNHNFTPTDEGNAFTVPEGGSVTAFLRWDDDWGRADCDLDLEMWRRLPPGEWVLVKTDPTLQDGSPGSDPFARVDMDEATAAEAGLYDFGIVKYSCADDPSWIQLITWIDDDLQHQSPGHHVGNPEETRNPGILTVGATHYWDTNTIATYSSRGPTIDGRTKPEIAGVACGRSEVYPVRSMFGGTCWFDGTSQASPHVAGLAALVKQRAPNFTPSHVARFMMQNAQERGPDGPDNTWGHGFAVLPDPSADIPPTVGDAIAARTVTIGSPVMVQSTITDPDGSALMWDATSSDDMIATATVNNMGSVTITGVAAGTATITVTASSGAVTATQTIVVTVRSAMLGKAANVTIGPFNEGGTMQVNWDAADNATGYIIYASNKALAGSANPDIVTDSVNDRMAETFNLSGLTPGQTYYIFVVATSKGMAEWPDDVAEAMAE